MTVVNLISIATCVLGGAFTEEEESAIGNLLGRSVTRGTTKGYAGHWRKWLNFLETFPSSRRPGNCLENIREETLQAKWVVLFIAYLRDVREVRGVDSISQVLSGVRFFWKKTGADSTVFDNPIILQAKKGARLTTDEIRESALLKEEERFLPVCTEMVLQMRKQLWEQSGSDSVGLDMKGTYLAAALSFDMGLRPGNVRARDGPDAEDHCIRAKHFRFRILSSQGQETKIIGGQAMRDFLNQTASNIKLVLGVDIVVLTGKTQHRQCFSQEAKALGRGNVFEELLLEDLCEWMQMSGVRSDDEVFTRYSMGSGKRAGICHRRVVTAKDLRKAVKAACSEFGFNPKNFGPKSLRKGFATHMTASGISREDMVSRAGWSLRSRVPEGHYIQSFSRGAFSAALDEEGEMTGLGLEGTRRLLVPRAVAADR